MTLPSRILFSSIALAFSADATSQDTQVAEGLPEHLLYIYTRSVDAGSPQSAYEQLVAGDRRWEAGRTLRVCLFGGNRSVAALIRGVAAEWGDYSSVKFDFGPADTGYDCLAPNAGFFQIRIGFAERGYWSVLGKDSDRILDPLVPSMNLEQFNRTYSEGRFQPDEVIANADAYHKAVILHEFGHALALLHEHQNPALGCTESIRWEGTNNVYDYFSKPPNNWSKSQVDRNLGFIGQTDADYLAGDPDPASIMMYYLPTEIFKPEAVARCALARSYEISTKDKQVIASIYPPVHVVPSAPLDLDPSTADIRPLPQNVPEHNSRDTLLRAVSDLESPDAFMRRDARVRLSNLFKAGLSRQDMEALVAKMPSSSYKYQLGIAVALNSAGNELALTKNAQDTLKAVARSSNDATLKRTLKGVATSRKWPK